MSQCLNVVNGFHIQPMNKAFDWIFRYWSVSTHFLKLDIWLRALLKTVAHITRSCPRGRENDIYHVHTVFSVLCCVHIVYFVLCIVQLYIVQARKSKLSLLTQP